MTLHPFFAAVLERNAEGPALSSGTPDDARALVALGRPGLGAGPEMSVVRDLTIPTRGGDLPARLLVPPGDVSGRVVYAHGGGWVVGSLDDFDTLGRALAEASGCGVLLVDYRLAPETRFPGPLEDVEDALVWASASVELLVGAAVPLIAMGDSAGGNLVTVACRRLSGQVDVALQVLVYPVTGTDLDTESYRHESDGMALTRKDMGWFLDHYAAREHWTHEDVAPLLSDRLVDLPPTLVVTAEHDVLRTDGEQYAAALAAVGVPVTHTTYAGTVHGFLRLHNHVDVSQQALMDIATAITDAVGRPVDFTPDRRTTSKRSS